MKDSKTLSISSNGYPLAIEHSTCLMLIKEQDAIDKFYNDILARYYCDEGLKERLKNRKDDIRTEVHYFSYIEGKAEMSHLHYYKTVHYTYSEGYHASQLGNTIYIKEDIGSDHYEVEVDKYAGEIGLAGKDEIFDCLDRLNSVTGKNIIVHSLPTGTEFTDYAQLIDDDIYEETKDKMFSILNKMQDNLASSIKKYVKENNGSKEYSVNKYSFHIYWCPVYKVMFDEVVVYINGLTNEIIDKMEYPRSPEYAKTKEKCIRQDDNLRKNLYIIGSFLAVLVLAGLATLLGIAISTLTSYQDIMIKEDISFEWFMISLSIIVWCAYNIPLFISLFRFISDVSGNNDDFVRFEIQRGYEKFNKSKHASNYETWAFSMRSLILIGLMIVHFFAGFMITYYMITTAYD